LQKCGIRKMTSMAELHCITTDNYEMVEIKNRGQGGSDSKYSAMTCALCSIALLFSSTYSSLIIH
jgi:hypothetical protein